jgi:hypothetical protein
VRGIEHTLGEISEDYAMPEFGKAKARVSATCRYIENRTTRRRRGVGESGIDVTDIGQDVSAPVAGALSIKLLLRGLLDSIERHRSGLLQLDHSIAEQTVGNNCVSIAEAEGLSCAQHVIARATFLREPHNPARHAEH